MFDIIVILSSSTQAETENSKFCFSKFCRWVETESRSADGLQWNLADLIISKDQQDFLSN